jgi:hypothetical protein
VQCLDSELATLKGNLHERDETIRQLKQQLQARDETERYSTADLDVLRHSEHIKSITGVYSEYPGRENIDAFDQWHGKKSDVIETIETLLRSMSSATLKQWQRELEIRQISDVREAFRNTVEWPRINKMIVTPMMHAYSFLDNLLSSLIKDTSQPVAGGGAVDTLLTRVASLEAALSKQDAEHVRELAAKDARILELQMELEGCAGRSELSKRLAKTHYIRKGSIRDGAYIAEEIADEHGCVVRVAENGGASHQMMGSAHAQSGRP